MAPWNFSASADTLRDALMFGAIGFGFGAALEMAGFGDTRKLAAQFYLREMTVLKVMFTAIVVAALLLGLASSFGLLDMSRVWVNPTHLWPGIVGGLIMGVGFVIGGFCPGTSAVATATLKVDGMFFLLGVLFGIFAFGESVGSFEAFFLSSDMGRFTLPEWLGLSTGATLAAVVAMALGMFYLAELAEQHWGLKRAWADIALAPKHRSLIAGAGLLASASLLAWAHGQPSPEQKWASLSEDVKRSVEERAIFIHPAEVVQLRQDPSVQVAIYDLRTETDFNLFHVGGSRRLDPDQLGSPEVVKPLLEAPTTTVSFLMSNGEQASLAAWKSLKAQGVANLYVVEGGINRWLELYPAPRCVAQRASGASAPEALGYQFAYSVGSHVPAAWPDLPTSRQFRSPCDEEAANGEAHPGAHAETVAWPHHPFTPRVKLKTKVAMKGGCG